MAADDEVVLEPRDDGLDHAPLADCPGQRFEFAVADAARVGWVWSKVIDKASVIRL